VPIVLCAPLRLGSCCRSSALLRAWSRLRSRASVSQHPQPSSSLFLTSQPPASFPCREIPKRWPRSSSRSSPCYRQRRRSQASSSTPGRQVRRGGSQPTPPTRASTSSTNLLPRPALGQAGPTRASETSLVGSLMDLEPTLSARSMLCRLSLRRWSGQRRDDRPGRSPAPSTAPSSPTNTLAESC
jgi:hypothetical protein